MSEQIPPSRPRLRARADTPRVVPKFALPTSFYNEVLQRLDEIRQRENERWRRRPGLFGRGGQGQWYLPNIFDPSPTDELYRSSSIPTLDDLTAIIEGAFWASLRTEEGRALKFAIGFGGQGNNLELEFVFPANSYPFTVDSLTKLAPALSFHSEVLVGRREGFGTLLHLGILAYSKAPFGLKILDPGVVILSYAHRKVAYISGDRVDFFTTDIFHMATNIWRWTQSGEIPADDLSWLFRDKKIQVVQMALRQMRLAKHGGTLLCGRNFNLEEQFASIAFSLESPSRLITDEVTRILDEEAQGNTGGNGFDFFESMSEILAKLTAVDGATLLTADLEIAGFGAMIVEHAEDFDVLVFRPFETNEIEVKPLRSFVGKRHQSGARFAQQAPGSVAFVVSQDGRITAFTVVGDQANAAAPPRVHAYTELELTLL